MFSDDDHFWEVVPKYPAEYLVGGDEIYDEAKASFQQVRDALIKQRKEMEGTDGENAIEKLVDTIWQQFNEDDQGEMNKMQTK